MWRQPGGLSKRDRRMAQPGLQVLPEGTEQ